MLILSKVPKKIEKIHFAFDIAERVTKIESGAGEGSREKIGPALFFSFFYPRGVLVNGEKI